MSRRRIGWTVMLALLALAFVGSGAAVRILRGEEVATGKQGPGEAAKGPAGRIVSLAPSVTEVTFAVGCGDRLVGATRYCTHPEAAKRIPRIGGYSDPSLEVVLGLKPDLVVGNVGVDHRSIVQGLRPLGVPVLLLDQGRIEGVLTSFREVGRACGREAQGAEIAASLRRRLDRVARLTRDRSRRSVLVVFARGGAGGALDEVYAAGRGGLYEEVIHLAGGRNAYPRRIPAFPKLGPEGILQLDPDVIVELASEGMAGGHRAEDLARSWEKLPGLRAVKAGRVRVLPGEFSEVPGPRLFRLVEEVARTVHPEVDWGAP